MSVLAAVLVTVAVPIAVVAGPASAGSARAVGGPVIEFETVEAPSRCRARGGRQPRQAPFGHASPPWWLTTSSPSSAADDVTIELFDDVIVELGASGELVRGEGGAPTWSATTPDTVVTLSFADDGVRGSISVGSTTYSIVPATGTTHLIFEEGRALPNETEAAVPPVAVPPVGEFQNDGAGTVVAAPAVGFRTRQRGGRLDPGGPGAHRL